MAKADPETAPIAVFSFPGIGDFVRSHTAVQLIRERHPHRPIDMIGPAPAYEIAALMTHVRRGIEAPFGGHRKLQMTRRLAFANVIRRERYRTAYILSRSWKPAIVPFLAGIPERIGWWGEARFWVINRPRIWEYRNPRMVDQLAALTLARGEKRPFEWPEPHLRIDPRKLAQLQHSGAVPNETRPVATIAPGSTDEKKNWPLDRFAQLARWLAQKGYAVWILGSAAEQPMAEALQSASGGHARVLVQSDLLTSAYCAAVSDVFVGNDSGMLHIAAALGVPSVGIYTMTPPFHAGPINRNVRFVLPPLRQMRYRDWTAHWPEVDEVIEAVQTAEGTKRNLDQAGSA